MNFKQKKLNIIEQKNYIDFFGKSEMKNLKSKIKISISNIFNLFCRFLQPVCRLFADYLQTIYILFADYLQTVYTPFTPHLFPIYRH